MEEKQQHALIASAWGHKGSDEHLSNMGRGLYNRYCLGDDFSGSAKDFTLMVDLCEQLKSFKECKKEEKGFFSHTDQTSKPISSGPKFGGNRF